MVSRAERLAMEKRLIESAQSGDRSSMYALIESVRPLIWRIINQKRSRLHSARGIDEHDLEQNAYTYVIYAISKFDTNRGLFFITYATHWINHGIQILLRKAAHFGSKETHSVDETFFPNDQEQFYDVLADENAEDPLDKTIQEQDYNNAILTSFVTQVVRERLKSFKSVQENPSIISDIVVLRWMSDSVVSLSSLGKKYKLSRTTMSTIERAMKREVAKALRE